MTRYDFTLYMAALVLWASYCGYYRHSSRRFVLGLAAIVAVTVRSIL